ncbi:MAG: DUF3098 domain-containing protein [Phaeodactylibacter sp.]|nr:DUF3098 domain-containing protein [Phaeodactylibacter sp.]MCB9263709.1 DUF3098 domain-containing protein [Lewinellaceae bacterium]MCB9286884.1 DUF3098 domain-containing protein [Lewinellaceae bacterium]
MSKSKPPKKKVVVTTQKSKVSPTTSRRRAAAPESSRKEELEFGRLNYLIMGAGALLIAIGLFLMAGGAMPSPDVWDDSIIYSTRRTLIAPMVILAGLIVEIFAIFKRA